MLRRVDSGLGRLRDRLAKRLEPSAQVLKSGRPRKRPIHDLQLPEKEPALTSTQAVSCNAQSTISNDRGIKHKSTIWKSTLRLLLIIAQS